ncbi:YciI family protein [Amycolatopsis sp. QT-25]|uniref:YciI family protein n=1 Tax=Amycolatopsis sp. QT-25 TaxID=3034022 RepID=UPI0023ED1B9C|nr:YciI family protein [Amycolatopsis sp. QT-25]WET76179.1 YciI family protein [Amycolatopsis sp. QT-25]
MIHSNPTFRDIWEDLPNDKRMEFGRAHMTLNTSLDESGELILSEGLADPSLAKCVTVQNGKTVTSDGPFAEVKEHLVGFYLIECDTIERALEHAARVPDAQYGKIEVRPIQNVKAMDF